MYADLCKHYGLKINEQNMYEEVNDKWQLTDIVRNKRKIFLDSLKVGDIICYDGGDSYATYYYTAKVVAILPKRRFITETIGPRCAGSKDRWDREGISEFGILRMDEYTQTVKDHMIKYNAVCDYDDRKISKSELDKILSNIRN